MYIFFCVITGMVTKYLNTKVFKLMNGMIVFALQEKHVGGIWGINQRKMSLVVETNSKGLVVVV